jgi:hypothetical protein
MTTAAATSQHRSFPLTVAQARALEAKIDRSTWDFIETMVSDAKDGFPRSIGRR